MLNATIVGKYFYRKNPDLTDIQIQKITYYAYSWYMVKNNGRKLFDERPEAWIHGPVFRTLYNSMKNRRFYDLETEMAVDAEYSSFLDLIYEIYGKFSGNELEYMTHSELPWQNARRGVQPNERSANEISDEDIMQCYGNN